ncbi:porin [Massilia sp. YIM B02769]|uniref:porin n=1 Tax=Massilia sp. YIM B02769 TaxID=3050129 RepID=UPI0025B6C85B|nr:porin [Massilia sp. YIM B02769]MDN4060464.1 porin [Massilia sp. YIM B02769]
MLKSLFTFALLGGSAAAACAQSGVTTYGVLDAGVVGESGCANGCTTKVGSGVASTSRIGIQGSESIGDTTSAVFGLETELKLDTGRAADRQEREQGRERLEHQAWVGLSGEFGAITIGRQYNLQYLALTDVADPFKGGTAGSATNLIGGPRRTDNSVQYYKTLANGFSAGASWAARDLDTSAAGRAWGMTVGLSSGPLTVRAAHRNQGAVRANLNYKTSNDMTSKNSLLAANLRLGWGTAYAAYSMSRGIASSPLFNPDNPYSVGMARTPSTRSRDVLFGMAVPVSNSVTLLGSYIRKDDRDLANQDANQAAFGASYSVSRRTDFYAAYSHIRNRNGAGYTVGNASAPGSGNKAFNVGMRHAF